MAATRPAIWKVAADITQASWPRRALWFPLPWRASKSFAWRRTTRAPISRAQRALKCNWFRNNGFGNGTPIENPEWRDNRYGGKIGGPIWKNRTFFFLHEEERHFFTQAVFSRLVPTAALRAGILEFKDASGNIIPYNLN